MTTVVLVNSYRAGIGSGIPPGAWTPAVITTALWFDATDGATITTDGSTNVSSWSDKSGNSRHSAQATPSNRPAYVASGIGGLPTIRFDGTNDRLVITGGGVRDIIRNVSGFSVFAVAKWNAFASGTGQILHLPTSNSGQARAQFGAISSSGNRLYMSGRRQDADSNQAILGTAGAIGTTNPVMQAALFNWGSAEGVLYLNGDLDASGEFHDEGNTSNTQASDTASIGAIQHSVPAAFASADISEIVAVPGIASTDVIDRIFGYFAWKYGLESFLDNSHPYKNHPPTL